jgi:hypothetical protein
MKKILLLICAFGLTACATHHTNITRSYGNDALPSAEVIAFEKVDKRLKYPNAHIEYDENMCANYQAILKNGTLYRQPLLGENNQPLCTH